MTFPEALPEIATKTAEVVDNLMSELRPRLLEAAFSGDVGENENVRHADNFLSVHDLWMHERYRESMSEYLGSFVYASEEGDPQVVGSEVEPDLVSLQSAGCLATRTS